MVFLASHIPCPIPAFSHFLGLGYSGVFQRKKTLVSSILQEKEFEINADFYGKWELGLEQRPRKVQGMLSRASIHGDTFTPNPPNSSDFPLPRPRLNFFTRFLNRGNNSRGLEFLLEGAAQLQTQQLLRVLPGSRIRDPGSRIVCPSSFLSMNHRYPPKLPGNNSGSSSCSG